jgi:hypothetical protein
MEHPHTAPHVSVPAYATSRCVVMAYLLLWRAVCATSVSLDPADGLPFRQVLQVVEGLTDGLTDGLAVLRQNMGLAPLRHCFGVHHAQPIVSDLGSPYTWLGRLIHGGWASRERRDTLSDASPADWVVGVPLPSTFSRREEARVNFMDGTLNLTAGPWRWR